MRTKNYDYIRNKTLELAEINKKQVLQTDRNPEFYAKMHESIEARDGNNYAIIQENGGYYVKSAPIEDKDNVAAYKPYSRKRKTESKKFSHYGRALEFLKQETNIINEGFIQKEAKRIIESEKQKKEIRKLAESLYLDDEFESFLKEETDKELIDKLKKKSKENNNTSIDSNKEPIPSIPEPEMDEPSADDMDTTNTEEKFDTTTASDDGMEGEEENLSDTDPGSEALSLMGKLGNELSKMSEITPDLTNNLMNQIISYLEGNFDELGDDLEKIIKRLKKNGKKINEEYIDISNINEDGFDTTDEDVIPFILKHLNKGIDPSKFMGQIRSKLNKNTIEKLKLELGDDFNKIAGFIPPRRFFTESNSLSKKFLDKIIKEEIEKVKKTLNQ